MVYQSIVGWAKIYGNCRNSAPFIAKMKCRRTKVLNLFTYSFFRLFKILGNTCTVHASPFMNNRTRMWNSNELWFSLIHGISRGNDFSWNNPGISVKYCSPESQSINRKHHHYFLDTQNICMEFLSTRSLFFTSCHSFIWLVYGRWTHISFRRFYKFCISTDFINFIKNGERAERIASLWF